MEGDSQEEKPSASSYFSRYRSPTFSKKEVKALLNIVEKYKTIVFNKSTSGSASHAKEVAWSKIAKIFNSQGFHHVRSCDSLKTKMDNLKREARKLSKNLMDAKYSDFDDVYSQMLAMMCDGENNTSNVEEPLESDEEIDNTNSIPIENHKEVIDNPIWNDNEVRESDESVDSDNEKERTRSLNFSPEECSLLLQCVRQEKSILLSKANTANHIKLKNHAWKRVANSYNKLSPQKRSTKMLRTKFMNMKRIAKNVNFRNCLKDFGKKHKLEDSGNKIKSEPLFDYTGDLDADIDDDVEVHNGVDRKSSTDSRLDSGLDPLNTVLSCDSGLGSISLSENKEVVKLKLELLNYELETAKLQRKRIEDLVQAEAAERESKAIENSLRLRAARLEVVAAEMKLPPAHPALPYTAHEAPAQHYIHQYLNQ